MFLRLSLETQQLLARMFHPGGNGLPVQPDWATVPYITSGGKDIAEQKTGEESVSLAEAVPVWVV